MSGVMDPIEMVITATDKDTDVSLGDGDVTIDIQLAEKECQAAEDNGDNFTDCRLPSQQGKLSKGVYTHPLAANGVINVTVSKMYYITNSESITVNCSYDRERDCSLCNATIPVELKPMSCDDVPMEVFVRDKASKKNIANANVTVVQGQVTRAEDIKTDEEGKITLSIPGKGKFQITVDAEHYTSHVITETVECDVYKCGECKVVLEIELEYVIYPCPGAPFQLVIFDNRTLEPLENALVNITANGESIVTNVETNARGEINTKILTNQSIDISVGKQYYESTVYSDVSLCCDMSDLTCLECNLTIPVGLKQEECLAATVTISKEDFATTTIETNIDCPLDNCGQCQHKIKTTIPKTAPKCKGVSEFNITVEYDNESGDEVPLEGVTVKILLENSEDYEKATLIT